MTKKQLVVAKSYLKRADAAYNSLLSTYQSKDIFGVSMAIYYPLYYAICALYILDTDKSSYVLSYGSTAIYLHENYVKKNIFDVSVLSTYNKSYNIRLSIEDEHKDFGYWESVEEIYDMVKIHFIEIYNYTLDYCRRFCEQFGEEVPKSRTLKVVIRQVSHGIKGLIAFMPQIPVSRGLIFSYSVDRVETIPQCFYKEYKIPRESTKKYSDFVNKLKANFDKYNIKIYDDISDADLEIAWKQHEAGESWYS